MTLQLQSISKYFGTRCLFDELSLQMTPDSRIGLIGRNGCGKSTLLKVIMRMTDIDSGSIAQTPGMTVNYLSQEPRITPELTLLEEMKTVFAEVHRLEAEEQEVLKLMETATTDEEHMDLAERFANIHHHLAHLDVTQMDAKIGRILRGLGFSLADHDRKTGDFSGGWQMRINLAKVLLEGSDILLLDEPTNHLDLEACEWLEDFLKEYPGGLMIVSHDRRFLDKVTKETAELDKNKLTVWPGNYSKHLELKDAAYEQQLAAYERQQKELTKQQAFVDKFRASATRSTQAKSREKQLDKIERLEMPTQDKRRMSIKFPVARMSGQEVITLKKVSKAFADKKLFENVNADIERSQRIFLLGANGCGKTTFLKVLLGIEKPSTGEVKEGQYVSVGYFSQNQLDTLDPKLNIFDTIQNAAPKLDNTQIRTMLGCFLFSGEQVFQPVSVLSGGEKSKVALAKLITSGHNTLFLDEPTNHMDIPAKDVITDALKNYEGTMLCISHDRHFIQELSTHIWEIYEGQLLVYCGNYDYYLTKRDETRAQAMAQKEKLAQKAAKEEAKEIAAQAEESANSQSPDVGGTPLKARKESEKALKKVEKDIEKLEAEIATLHTQLETPDIQQDFEKLQSLSQTVGGKEKLLGQLNQQWAELAETLS